MTKRDTDSESPGQDGGERAYPSVCHPAPDDIIVRLINLPIRVRGFVVPSADGKYNVYLNARQSAATQRATYDHEIRHVLSGDLTSRRPVHELEPRADLSKSRPKL